MLLVFMVCLCILEDSKTVCFVQYLIMLSKLTILGGSLVAAAWRVIRLWMKEMVSSYGG
jgi:hypothetical protein